MSEYPYMQLYVGDYLRDTQHLTIEQSGCYLHILMAMWTHGGSLPNDEKILAKICRISARRWRAVNKPIMALLKVFDDKVSSKRLRKELTKARRTTAARRAAGKLGGRPKILKNNKLPKANAKANGFHARVLPEPYSVSPKGDTGVATPEFPDLRKQVFDLARPTLVVQGEAKSKAGEIIGSWRKLLGNDDATLLGILADVIAQQPACLKTAMFKRFNGGGNGAHSPPSASRRGRSSVFELSRDEARLVREEI